VTPTEGRLQTTHTGSLPRPQALLEGFAEKPGDLEETLRTSVRDVVRQQQKAGLDLINDGEFGKPTDTTADDDHGHGVWIMYVRERLGGFGYVEREKPKIDTRDREDFPIFFGAEGRRSPGESGKAGQAGKKSEVWSCTGPITYVGDEVVSRDIENLKASLGETPLAHAFLPVVSPGSVPDVIPNEFYGSLREYEEALAEAMREEYLAIAAAGLTVQIDDPVLVAHWDMYADLTPKQYRKEAEAQVELINHTIRGIPQEQLRYHLCWGSWQGPHANDLPLAEVVDLMLKINAQGYLIEAGNPRHEHEWKIWRDTKLPDDKVLIPGVVGHKTTVVEHPEVVADRLLRYAEVVGRERVIAGTDCGLGGRISSDVAWAKIDSLVEGARIASSQLWR
jgi:5-methyltetrahydropteroyltriglutamate--homocysteine methyltransferase